ncbi:MAG: hypothetical protein AAFY19_02385 [Pseudomonadota bacterium]
MGPWFGRLYEARRKRLVPFGGLAALQVMQIAKPSLAEFGVYLALFGIGLFCGIGPLRIASLEFSF